MNDRLIEAPEYVRRRVDALGAERLFARLSALVDGHEEDVVTWFDAEYGDRSADEVLGWTIADVGGDRQRAAVTLSLELATYSIADNEAPMDVVVLPAVAHVSLESPDRADVLDWERPATAKD